MKKCLKCDSDMPNWVMIGDKRVNTQRRKFCLSCSPFGWRNTRDLTKLPATDTVRKPGVKYKSKHKTTPAQVQLFRERRKARIVASMGGSCQCCGYNRYVGALELHHLDPNEKEFSCGSASANPIKWERLVVELRKCVMLCSNCHRDFHYQEKQTNLQKKTKKKEKQNKTREQSQKRKENKTKQDNKVKKENKNKNQKSKQEIKS